MAEHLSQSFEKSAMTKQERKKIDRERNIQVIAFAFMIFITLLAFLAVGSDIFPQNFVIPFILLLAAVQFFLQLFYFMHLKDKNHAWPNAFMVAGIFVATPTLIALSLLLGVVKY
ncbi:cytochrome C oxidase subunit IV family protein [Bacillus sp. FJAT-44742]|uniref:cytochrome C oxidase subunit IV family protein n=1 Tax=Bacillus sp. FJAT-44742 TaxID=2014005 RepID=UPI000C23DAEB|nr:cytochrome C oxidase subunit IV family protein [Bacillus sp. FJAT-44742]